MSFEHFVESLDNVPPEFERNFTLIGDLDQRTAELIARINELTKEYRDSRKKSERLAIRRESDDLFEKLSSFAQDKIDLAVQTYELIDRSIIRLVNLAQLPTTSSAAEEANETNGTSMLGYEMPLDPYEPKYCHCHSVSHGEMVMCDNAECPIEWFHFGCVGLKSTPKGKWYCSQCIGSCATKQRPRAKRRR